jgi:hypothetical protein
MIRSQVHSPLTIFVNEYATRRSFLHLLPEHTWLHLASRSTAEHIELYDGTLSVDEVAALQVPDAQMAFLSGTDTMTGKVDIPDESFTLATAFQFIGFRHVIATRSNLDDLHATNIAREIY